LWHSAAKWHPRGNLFENMSLSSIVMPVSGLAYALHNGLPNDERLAARAASIRRLEPMTSAVIQDWTNASVPLRPGNHREVHYRVIREGERLFQEIRNPDLSPVRRLELPQGMLMEKSSYEVLLRFMLHNVNAA
jgi:hypothetical protein